MASVSIKDLSKIQRDIIVYDGSSELSSVPVNRKADYSNPIKSSLETLPTYVSIAQKQIIQIINSDNSNIVPGFTGPNSIEFYTNVLNTIDNMILLGFIRDNQTLASNNNVNTTVTKTTDISIDISLVYYSIKYPFDTTVDPNKLEEIKNEINSQLFN